VNAHDIEIRQLGPEDSIEELTALLHRAYARLGRMGLNYTAVDQDVDVTRQRIAKGTCYLAVTGTGQICGTIVLYGPIEGEPSGAALLELQRSGDGAAWLKQPGIAHLGQFAVDPDLQGQGLGAQLMHKVEAQAGSLNATEIALDTAEPAAHLVALYTHRGYRFVGYAQWSGKTYRSVIMSKDLR
jgi:GNAT superfamily N-acetyltransferase